MLAWVTLATNRVAARVRASFMDQQPFRVRESPAGEDTRLRPPRQVGTRSRKTVARNLAGSHIHRVGRRGMPFALYRATPVVQRRHAPMRYLALACDYDGTIAHHGRVDDDTLAALRRVRASGRKLLLVTGRELDDLQ